MAHKTFDTERLTLKPTSEEDAAFIFDLLNTPKWIQHIGDRNVRSIEGIREYIRANMTPQLEKLGYANYTLIRKKDQQKIGTCGLYDRNGLDGIDIGFALLPAYEQQDFAFEAASRVRDAAFHEFGLASINAITTKDNTSSQKLLAKLGLSLTGTIRLPDDKEELLAYVMRKP